MTREEAIKEINRVFEPAYANYIVVALTEGATVSDVKKLPSVNPQEPCDDVLDKIRAEIEHVIDNTYDSTDYDKALYNGAYKDGLYEALEIIDKHRKEQTGV